MFPLKNVEHVDRVACWERPPKRYGPRDEPWVSVQTLCRPFSITCLFVRFKKSRFTTNPLKSCRRLHYVKPTWRPFARYISFIFACTILTYQFKVHAYMYFFQDRLARFYVLLTLFCSIQEYIYMVYDNLRRVHQDYSTQPDNSSKTGL